MPDRETLELLLVDLKRPSDVYEDRLARLAMAVEGKGPYAAEALAPDRPNLLPYRLPWAACWGGSATWRRAWPRE